jgi:heme-degrading monooxygenase HmoA
MKGYVMVLEIVQVNIKPGMAEEFEANVAKAVPIFKRAKGCSSMNLRRVVENPDRYMLFVEWDTLENHTVDFRGSDDFKQWRQLVGHCFDGDPDVVHGALVVSGF